MQQPKTRMNWAAKNRHHRRERLFILWLLLVAVSSHSFIRSFMLLLLLMMKMMMMMLIQLERQESKKTIGFHYIPGWKLLKPGFEKEKRETEIS